MQVRLRRQHARTCHRKPALQGDRACLAFALAHEGVRGRKVGHKARRLLAGPGDRERCRLAAQLPVSLLLLLPLCPLSGCILSLCPGCQGRIFCELAL